MARSLGLMFVVGPAIALTWLLLGEQPRAADEALILAMIVLVAALGLALLSGRLGRLRARGFAVLVALANGALTVSIYAAATPASGYAFFYLWATPYAYVFLSGRMAILQTVLAGAGLSIAMVTMPGAASLEGLGLISYVLVSVSSVASVGVLARRLNGAARASDHRFSRGFHLSSLGAAMLSPDLRFAEVNDSLARMLGYEPEQFVGRSVAELTHTEDRPLTIASAPREYGGRVPAFEKRCIRSDGEEVWVRVNTTPMPTENGGPTEVFALIEDITDRKNAEATAAELARDNELILRSAGDGIIRIDKAGKITHANPAAARLLGWSTRELIGARAHELFHHSRANGAPNPIETSPIFAATLGGDVHRSTSEVFWRADGSSFPVDYTSAPVRSDGKTIGAVCVFADITETMKRERELRAELDLAERVARAISAGDLVAHSQPIVELGGGRMVGEELLVRLRGTTPNELIPPSMFLPQAERARLMPMIDRQMLQHGLALARRGRHVAVNLSSQSLLESQVLNDIENAGEELARVTLEITETAAVENMDAARSFCERVKQLGCRIALDDFGTGFGAFSYLRSIPVDYLKIDMEFVRDIATSRSDERIVRTIVGIARELELKTIAEGVETEHAQRVLAKLGVDYAQGYLFGYPGPVDGDR